MSWLYLKWPYEVFNEDDLFDLCKYDDPYLVYELTGQWPPKVFDEADEWIDRFDNAFPPEVYEDWPLHRFAQEAGMEIGRIETVRFIE